MGMLGWQEYAISDGGSVTRKVKEKDLPLSLSLGILGLNGVTAYFGLLEIGQPRSGDTVVVSTAAGAVGSAVGQIARLMGCRTVGLTGGAVKAKLCREEFGYDEAIDYKAGDLAEALSASCPRGVDVYFDNTAGLGAPGPHPLPRGHRGGDRKLPRRHRRALSRRESGQTAGPSSPLVNGMNYAGSSQGR